MLPDPARAPARTDLPWLRHRDLRRAPAPERPRIDLVHHGRPAPGSSTVERLTEALAPMPVPPVDAARAVSALDLSAPTPAPAHAPAQPPAPSVSSSLDLGPTPAPVSSSLDLGSTPAAPRASGPTTSLDLSSPPTPRPTTAPAAAVPPRGPAAPGSPAAPATLARPTRKRTSAANGDAVLGYEPERVVVGRPTVLNRDRPTLALTRVQSGVGALRVSANVSAEVGDLRLAALCRLTSGESVLLDHNRGMTSVPVGSRRPVVQAIDRGFLVDLRQVTRLRRLVIAGFSPTASALAWAGALRVETIGGARVDVPLEHAQAAGSLVALTILNVDGQLVLRAERQLVPGALRDAALAFGFDEMTWVDKWTPLV
ncbi:MAG: hypothetical protein AAGC49_06105 [Brevundimonas sp.]